MSKPDPLPWNPEEFREPLRKLAHGLLPDRQANNDAADLVQDTMLYALSKLNTCQATEPGKRFAWLSAIMTNLVNQQYRHKTAKKRDVNREVNLDASAANLERWLAADQTSPTEAARLNERAEKLAQALKKLPEEQRRAIILKDLEGRTCDEIADELHRSVAAVMGLLQRGRRSLRTCLENSSSRSSIA